MCDPYVFLSNYSVDLIWAHDVLWCSVGGVWEDFVLLPLSHTRLRKVVRLWKATTRWNETFNKPIQAELELVTVGLTDSLEASGIEHRGQIWLYGSSNMNSLSSAARIYN